MNMNELFAGVMELDLGPIKKKLMHVESGEGWTAARADAVEKEYRCFLCLMKMYPNELISPLVDVDTFWHYHILDTMKYARDCEQVFGYFLHHYPYVGLGDEDDEQDRVDSGERMRTLYEATFGDSFTERAAALAQSSDNPGARPIDLSGVMPSIRAGKRPQQAAASAYCAGPVPRVAYCAGPVPRIRAEQAAATAYCAGPVPRIRAEGLAATAYCAGPVPRIRADKAAATAYCAGPVPRIRAEGLAATAYCAGPVPRIRAEQAAASLACH